ncbi:hypothetical protein HMPREF9396_1039 [Streptococcus sanguinis SK1059]|nr:hypothetical protein HMPREF9396_1039 [Streptococcus sanguinis SK1059]EGQ20388.1 hypothetical protein HMPREF8573_1028 [Streptococcus sanguinis ATCC 29667]
MTTSCFFDNLVEKKCSLFCRKVLENIDFLDNILYNIKYRNDVLEFMK